ncbi:MAG: excinuclease ABC subunit UvrC [Peptoniphilus sp.]|nr:excinuclease ABC subunit UvrC [Peptoniphilus sp.]
MFLEEKLKKLPDLPGVYLMKDKNDNIIYVGKAKSLKNRVRQYFGSYGNSSLKVKSMVDRIADFEYIIVKNEIESLILENNLIKDKNPKYNILLRDDKQYPYIKIPKEKYPRVLKTRRILKDSAEYFGPYPNASAVNDSIEIFNKIYKLRTCSLNFDKNPSLSRPCLNYFIKRCKGPCKYDVDETEYNENINEIRKFLSGKDLKIIESLEQDMKKAVDEFRDNIKSLNLLNEKQIITNTDITENKDVVAMARGVDEAIVQVFFIRNGKIVGREHYFLRDYFNDDNAKLANAFIKQFYGGAAFIPKEIIIETEPEDVKILEEFLSERKNAKVKILEPKRGENLDLLKLVKKNALDMLDKYADRYRKKLNSSIKALNDIKDTLGLTTIPKRIEAYDISNTYGIESVGSMVVFEDGIPKKSDYRKFKIKTITGADDYGSLREVLIRRFTRGIKEIESKTDSSFSRFPDLIMMDGGKGQTNIAQRVLDELKIDIAVCGLVKDDFHNTRGIIYNNEEFNLDINSGAFKMIFKIQEEAHRFAINYHRSLRTKNIFKSELDGIEHIGPKRKLELMNHFKSISKIKEASIEELVAVKSMDKKAAQSIYDYFRS